MKSLKKTHARIALLAAMFIGGVIFLGQSLNQAQAATNGEVALTVNGGSGGCYYGTAINLGSVSVSAVSKNLSGNFYSFNTGATVAFSTGWGTYNSGARGCVDMRGTGAQRDSVFNIAINDLKANGGADAASVIASGFVKLYNNAGLKVKLGGTAGSCATFVPAIANNGTQMSGAATVLGNKTAGSTGEVCEVYFTGTKVSVDVPAYRAPGTYTGLITINIPTL